jgi:hypothetical protein
MFQSKWVRIPVKIILIWLVITLYFYFQHPVVYRYLDLDANIPIGDAQLLLHEIQVSNLDEDKRYDWIDDEEMPWRIRISHRMYEWGLPSSWRNPVYKVLMFYSWPPLAEDFWTYRISGTFISPEDLDVDKSVLDNFSVYVFPAMRNSSGSQWEGTLRNAAMISARGKINRQQLDNPLNINVVDKENDRTTRLVITPQWQKERLIYGVSRIEQYKSPARPVERFMYNIYAGQPQQARDHVLPELRHNFPLPALNEQLKGQDIEITGRLSWTDIYNDYLNVYRMDAEVGKSSENNFVPVEILTFHIILDEYGDYKIIDWKSAD